MRQSVRDAFVSFTEKFEGSVPTMYVDIKGLITVAIGNLIDPIGAALDLPFMRADGSLASRAEIGQEWRLMKTSPGLSHLGWTAAAKIAKLHLSPEGISQLVAKKLAANEHYLVEMKDEFPDFSTWPSDAQLAVLSMAWACGPAFPPRFPKFTAAMHRRDFAAAALQSHMEDSHNAGLIPRNRADIVLLNNAAAVEASGADPEVLRYPDVATFPIAAQETGTNGE